MKHLPVAGALLCLAGPASAQDFIEGTWLTSQDACESARKGGLASVLEEGDLMLDARGLHGYEYHCDFLQVLKGVRTPAWTVIAQCAEPGFASSELITIVQHDERRVELVSSAQMDVSESDDGEESAGAQEYVRCEGEIAP